MLMPKHCSKAGLPVLRFDWKLAQGHQYCPTTICTFSASREGEPVLKDWPPDVKAKLPSGPSSQMPRLTRPRKKRWRCGADKPSLTANSPGVAALERNRLGSPSFTAA